MSNINKRLLIVEKSVADLKPTEGNKYVLEGVFTEFGIKNKNNRIYEAKEFLPHLKQLQEKMKTSKVVGELDHPKDFEISLSNASHYIESIVYDEANSRVVGKIQLTSNAKGRDARALVDDGIPLHISSRAAGTVKENGIVQIQKLFTYDLVADPGFANAQLNRVNEKYGFPLNENLSVFEVDDNNQIIEQTQTKTENKPEYIEAKETTSTMENYITKDDFNNYSLYVKNQLTQLKEEFSKTEDDSMASNKVEKLVAYCNKMAESMNKSHEYLLYVANKLDESIAHGDYIVEGLNSVKDYTNYLSEGMNKTIKYTNYLGENLDNSVKYQNYLGENLQNSIKYGNYLGEKINESSEELDGKFKKIVEYAEYLGVKLDAGIQYSENIGETVNGVVGYTEYLKENLQNLGHHNDYVVNNVNQIIKKINESETPNNIKPVTNTVSEKTQSTTEYRRKINENLEELVASAKKQKADNNDPSVHFLKFLKESQKNQFNALNEEKKIEVVNAFKTNKYFSSADADRIWESVFTPKTGKLDFIENMPDTYKESWLNLNEAQQSAIKAQSKFHPLNTQYQINNFWQTRDLRPVKVRLEKINETVMNESKNGQSATSERMDSIKNALKSRFDNLK